MILLNLQRVDNHQVLFPFCPIESGQEYAAVVTVQTERLEPIEALQVWVDIEMNGKVVHDAISGETDENGQFVVIFNVNPDFNGVVLVIITVMTDSGMYKISEKWSAEIGANYKDCFISMLS